MNQATQNYIRSIRLTNILDLQRIARGVNMDITQLDAGSFESDVSQLKVRNVLASTGRCELPDRFFHVPRVRVAHVAWHLLKFE
jgi:hypothetical protein